MKFDTKKLARIIVSCLDPKFLDEPYKGLWEPSNPTFGFCSLASEAAYFILGGPESGFMSYATKDENNTSHWWLQNKEGEILDLTAEQFYLQGSKPPYERGLLGRPVGFMGMRIDVGNPFGFDRKPSLRVQWLLKRILETNNISYTESQIARFRESFLLKVKKKSYIQLK
ncbi:MAG: hypothetical protein EPN31_15575 [Castellaniella sp.]|uniref:hypothetical protein n=1 Tax=Castellaniella sp. TaxID=1955812 RepID=UPI0011FD868C|nr:hypothetical protein [Castellaniella sp.]TAN25327.1 MAG: hypothetical protein EPN31_15575 [Castellaniella sp.]